MHLTSTLNGWPYLGFRASNLFKLLPEVVLTLLKGMLNEGGCLEYFGSPWCVTPFCPLSCFLYLYEKFQQRVLLKIFGNKKTTNVAQFSTPSEQSKMSLKSLPDWIWQLPTLTCIRVENKKVVQCISSAFPRPGLIFLFRTVGRVSTLQFPYLTKTVSSILWLEHEKVLHPSYNCRKGAKPYHALIKG